MVHGTVVECNTAYGGERDTTEQHIRTLEKHGWTKMFTVDLLDAEGPDMELSIPTEKGSRKISLGRIWQIMIPCWCWRISKDIPGEATAER